MIKPFSLIALIVLLPILAAGQEVTEAPVKWEIYNIREHKLSILMPKLPIKYETSEICSEKKTDHFVAYADEKVYRIQVVSKSASRGPLFGCPVRQKFGKDVLDDRREILNQNAARQDRDGIEVWQSIDAEKRPERTWIFDDLSRDRWIELSITGRGEFTRESEFVASFKKSVSDAGTDIGEGAARVLGDAGVDTSLMFSSPPKSDDGIKKPPTQPDFRNSLTIVSKVKASYTDRARTKNEQGPVKLRVTFLANGGIGDIKIEQGLRYGLTDEAIAAAKKMVFLPAKVDGKPATTTRAVSFTFNIY